MKAYNLIFSILLSGLFAFKAGAVTYETKLIYDAEQTYTQNSKAIAQEKQKTVVAQQPAPSSRGFMRGSMFGNSGCTHCKKGGAMFDIESCTRCKKGGAMFNVDSCTRCSKDGSFFPGGPCKYCNKNNNCKRCRKKATPTPAPKKAPFVMEYVDIEEHQCKDFAPFMLGHVDFRLKNAWGSNPSREKLGNYNFRIFGCRRFDKESFLNEGRTMQKDMMFTDAFAEAVSECYNMIQIPQDLCLQQTPTPLPEYVLNAEITNYFMNVCDGYNWQNSAQTNLRAGSSEITVVWKLMNLEQTNVVWEGTTTGYGELEKGEENGEILLVERAFADAASNLQLAEGFESQLASRISPEEMERQRAALIEKEKLENPAKCQYQQQIEQLTCPACNCPLAQPVEEVKPACPCGEPVITILPDGSELSTCPCATVEILPEPVVEEKSDCLCGGTKTVTLPDGSEISVCSCATVEILNEPIVEEKSDCPCGETKMVTLPDGSEVSVCSCATVEILQEPVIESGDTVENTVITQEPAPECPCGETKTVTLPDGSEISTCACATVEVLQEPVIERGDTIENTTITEDVVQPVEVDDVWVDVSSVKDEETLCIVDRPPYETLSPENLYRVRASVLSITNAKGKKGAGLLVSDSFVLTSADLIDSQENVYNLKTINGKSLTGKVFRVNPTKNVALLMLDQPTDYTPLSLNLDLPKIGKDNFMVLGMLDVDDFSDGENYLDNNGVIDGYRYTDDRGAEIILDTFVQDITIGGALIDEFGTINGIAHSTQKTEDGKDLFIPTETALRGVGLSICEKIYKNPSPWQTTVYKPVTEVIEHPVARAPEAIEKDERK